MILLDPMYDNDAGQGIQTIIILKNKKEVDAFRVLAEAAEKQLNKRSTAYKLAKRLADDLICS